MGVLQMNLGRDWLPEPDNLRRRIGCRLLAKVPLDAEMYRQNDGDNGHGAEHQDREENFNYHRDLGYQKGEPLPNTKAPSHPSRSDLPDDAFAIGAKIGCAIEVAAAVQHHVADGKTTIVAVGEIVQVGEIPAAA
jgi:hypothetical protein